jgi:hypothetical protein
MLDVDLVEDWELAERVEEAETLLSKDRRVELASFEKAGVEDIVGEVVLSGGCWLRDW